MSRIPLSQIEEVPDLPPQVEPKTPIRTSEEGSKIEVPYTDYEQQTNHPYLVDHFKLGDKWDDPQGGFPNEVRLIESYIQDKIKSGEVANSIKAIQGVIKDMEKFNNLKGEERAVVKLEVLSHYVEFLMKNERTRANLRRYNG
jgi:hypothetical protein